MRGDYTRHLYGSAPEGIPTFLSDPPEDPPEDCSEEDLSDGS